MRGTPGMGTKAVAALVALLAISFGIAAAGSATAKPKPKPKDGECVVTSKKGGANPQALDGVCELLESRDGIAQVALYDANAGRTYKLQTGDDVQVTASIVKVDI